MTDREKLIDLLGKCDRCNAEHCNQCEFEDDIVGCIRRQKEIIADKLLTNGVSFATDTNVGSKWISVEDRLPGTQKILITDGDIVMRGYRRPDGAWKYGVGAHETWDRLSLRPVTHWMPLPEPPKEV